MTEQTSPAIKTSSFGSCEFGRTSPALETLSPNTQVLNIDITFEEALKLHLAIEECVRKLNSYKRSTRLGKRTALNLAIHLSKRRVTVNEARLPAKAAGLSQQASRCFHIKPLTTLSTNLLDRNSNAGILQSNRSGRSWIKWPGGEARWTLKGALRPRSGQPNWRKLAEAK